MDKKGEPRSIRFRYITENTINEIASTEDMEWTETVEMLVNLGIQFWTSVNKNFILRPRYRTSLNRREDHSRDDV
jgi:hypothetical protein